MNQNDVELKRWVVTRVICETYEAYGKTKEDAKKYIASVGNPHSVRIMRESVTLAKSTKRSK